MHGRASPLPPPLPVPSSSLFLSLHSRLDLLLTAYEIGGAAPSGTCAEDPDFDLWSIISDDSQILRLQKLLKARITLVRSLLNVEWSSLLNKHTLVLSDPLCSLFTGASRLPGAGLGLFTKREVEEGEVVCCYVGDLESIQSFRDGCPDKTYGILLPLLPSPSPPSSPSSPSSPSLSKPSPSSSPLPLQTRDAVVSPSCLSRHRDLPGRYINDPRSRSHYNVAFSPRLKSLWAEVRATRRVERGEELFVDYGDAYWEGQGYEPASLRS